MDGYCLINQIHKAGSILCSMVGKGCKPYVFNYNFLINWYYRHGRMDEAIRLFAGICHKELIPDTVTHTFLMRGLCLVRRLVAMNEHFKEMCSKSHIANLMTFST
uniref:Pentatricopeptide repeat-containing protein n=1 Tax=Rhizophora mucronata TaxID=61149 RepID=A0A2P2MV92_RHIMU